jgi:putative endonuclease
MLKKNCGACWLYVVWCSDGTLYTGISSDVKSRVRRHNRGKGAKYTRSRRPVRLLRSWEYPDRSAAAKAEYAFKQLSRTEKLSRISCDGHP